MLAPAKSARLVDSPPDDQARQTDEVVRIGSRAIGHGADECGGKNDEVVCWAIGLAFLLALGASAAAAQDLTGGRLRL